MKLLCCILALCIVVNGEPVPSREKLANVVKIVLKNTEQALNIIDNITARTKEVVEEKLLENEHVKKVESTYDETESQITFESMFKCSITTLEYFNKLKHDIHNDLLEKITAKAFGKSDFSINTLKNELSQIRRVLNNHADEEIHKCLDEKNKCKLTEEFLPKVEEYIAFFNNAKKSAVLSDVKSSDGYFNSLEIEKKIITDFTQPAFECLDNAKS